MTLLWAWCFWIPDPKQVQEPEQPEEVVSLETETRTTTKSKYLIVRTTYYNPVEAQCDSDPLITADGSEIDLEKLRSGKLKWIAISQDLLPEYPLGTKVRITSKKYPEISDVYVIHDTMNPRFRYSIDVLCHLDHGHVFGTHLTRIEKV